MANALNILGDLLNAGISKSGSNRLQNALGEQGLGGGGGFLDQLIKNSGIDLSGSGNPLQDLGRQAGELLEKGQSSVKSGNPLAIGGLVALAGALLGGGGGAAKGALGGGALAVLASIAYKALNVNTEARDIQNFADLPLGLREPRSAKENKELESQAHIILKAMINAAKADGVIDQEELDRIIGHLKENAADADEIAFVQEELLRPEDLVGVIRSVPNKEIAIQVYAASLLANEGDKVSERAYLRELADGLGLNQSTVNYVHRSLGAA